MALEEIIMNKILSIGFALGVDLVVGIITDRLLMAVDESTLAVCLTIDLVWMVLFLTHFNMSSC